MCGIAGFVVRGTRVDLTEALADMAGAIAHRGPDDAGFFEASSGDWRIGLAHRRLSIIDLSSGHQPLGNEDGAMQIVFNGEIYNFEALREQLLAKGHRFATRSDTETIVHAYEEWGEACVERLRGMFAFALWDAKRQRLFLARDRFGKKPLYLHQAGETLLFASEIKSILGFPGVKPEADSAAMWDYFAYRYVPAPATLFRGIRKLMPGSWAVWERGVLREYRYYRPPDREPLAAPRLGEDPVGDFHAKLDEAVRLRMNADVPFGAFLSGGLDSSSIVALMSRHASQPIKTFSVGFYETAYSELQYALAVAQQFQTEHHELVISQAHLMEHLPRLVRFRDAPVAEPSDIPIYLLALEARGSVKMVLTGEGADEILGGYPKHVYEQYVRPYRRIPALLRKGLFEPLVAALPYRFRRAKIAMSNLALGNFQERMPHWFGAMNHDERSRLVAFHAPGSAGGDQFDTPAANSDLRRMLYFDQTSWLPDNLLERGDSMTMAASLEARMPFLDHELAAMASALPDDYRVRGRDTKWILRQAARRFLPAPIIDRPKVGFRVPVNEWFRGAMRDYLHDHLLGQDSRTAGYYRRDVLRQMLAEHAAGRHNHEKLLWCLLNLEIWKREYGLA
jgi:asparagine synthase (glutamine-hydrolysing)